MSVYYDNHQGAFGFHEFLGREYIKRPDAVLNRNASSGLFCQTNMAWPSGHNGICTARNPHRMVFSSLSASAASKIVCAIGIIAANKAL